MAQPDEEIVDSPTGWVAKHIRTYVESGGTKGHDFNGYDSLLLTTRGRRSGKLRRTPLIYGRDGDRLIVVASNGGATEHPLWYHNLVADPAVTVQVRDETFPALARTATPEERPARWTLMASVFPPYVDYQQKTGREIPVVLIERRTGTGRTSS